MLIRMDYLEPSDLMHPEKLDQKKIEKINKLFISIRKVMPDLLRFHFSAGTLKVGAVVDRLIHWDSRGPPFGREDFKAFKNYFEHLVQKHPEDPELAQTFYLIEKYFSTYESFFIEGMPEAEYQEHLYRLRLYAEEAKKARMFVYSDAIFYTNYFAE